MNSSRLPPSLSGLVAVSVFDLPESVLPPLPPAGGDLASATLVSFFALLTPILLTSLSQRVFEPSAESAGGLNRKAAFEMRKALSRRAMMIETLAVMPGLSFRSSLLTAMTVS